MYQLLTGLRVIEAASFIAGPSGGLHLAQLGAEVIRLDPIGGGPDYRRWPLAPNGVDSLYWEGLNKGKKSIAVDLSRQEGRELALALMTASGAETGLVLTNYPVDSFLSHSALKARREDIITLRVMGWADGAPAVDYTVNAATGIPMMTGPASPTGAAQPVNHVLPAWDLLAGAYAAFYLMAALHRRSAAGHGAEIRLPLSDVAATALGHMGNVAEVLTTGDRPPSGNDLYGAFGRDFCTRDGHRLIVVAITRKQWRGLMKALDLSGMIDAVAHQTGADFDTDEGARFQHRHILFPIFEAAFAARDAKDLATAFTDGGVTWAQYQGLHHAVTTDSRLFSGNPQFQTITHPSGLSYLGAGPAATVHSDDRDSVRPAPRLGEHTDEVLLTVLGLGSTEVAHLHDKGLVG